MLDQALQDHYRPPLSAEDLLSHVRQHAPRPLRSRDLAPIDQLHLGGASATITLLERAQLTAEHRVLDVGCGLGGSARLIAERFGCRVTGIDLSPAFVALAEALNQELDRPPAVAFLTGNALAMPFAAASFDRLLSQHCIMNIPDTRALLAEFARVLKPGGQLLIHEVVAGPGGDPHYPVPWASQAGLSFLQPRAQLEAQLDLANFRIEGLKDISQDALAWRSHHLQREQQQIECELPALSPALVLGSNFTLMGKNLWRNLKEDRVRVLEGICVKA